MENQHIYKVVQLQLKEMESNKKILLGFVLGVAASFIYCQYVLYPRFRPIQPIRNDDIPSTPVILPNK